MLGLIIISVMVVYLAFSIYLVRETYKTMKKKGRTGRKAWIPAAIMGLFMYLLMFWDHIPTLVAHKYYCDKYAGFTVYKTLEQWKAENPGVAETLTRSPDALKPVVTDTLRKYEINQRFRWEVHIATMMLGIKKIENNVLDKQENFELINYVDFTTDIENFSVGARGLRDYKFWLSKETCETSSTPKEIMFKKFKKEIWDMGNK